MNCLDTYVLMEVGFDTGTCNKYLNQDFIILDWILTEFYWVLLRDQNKQTADFWFKKFKPYSKIVSLDILQKAMLFRKENAKKKLSLFDCIGYTYAVENNMKFVTGDKQFKDFAHVDFVAKA